MRRATSTTALPGPGGAKQMLRLPEVAEIFGVSLRTARTWVASGRLEVVRLSPRTLRVAPESLEQFLRDAQERAP